MNKLPLALLAFAAFSLSSQNSIGQGKEVTLDPVQFSVNFIPLMAQGEFKLSENRSATLGAGFAFSAFIEGGDDGNNLEAYTTPFITSSFRNYYTRKRVKKDNLRNNSGNYVGIQSSYVFKTLLTVDDDWFETDLNSFSIGPVWGFQRNYASGIHLDLNLGLGFLTGQSDGVFDVEDQVTFIGNFELGFRINR